MTADDLRSSLIHRLTFFCWKNNFALIFNFPFSLIFLLGMVMNFHLLLFRKLITVETKSIHHFVRFEYDYKSVKKNSQIILALLTYSE